MGTRGQITPEIGQDVIRVRVGGHVIILGMGLQRSGRADLTIVKKYKIFTHLAHILIT